MTRESIREDAAELAVGFRLGLVSRGEIIAWADRSLLATGKPPYPLVELSLLGNAPAQDLLGKLGEIAAYRSPLEALPGALGRFTSRLRAEPELGPRVAEGLWGLAAESGYDVPAAMNAIYSFHDDFHLARNGILGTERDVYDSLLAFCERFESRA